MGLEVHPELGTIAEIKPQPERRIGGNAAPIIDDLGNPVGRDADRLRERVLRQTIARQKLLLQHFPRRDRCELV